MYKFWIVLMNCSCINNTISSNYIFCIMTNKYFNSCIF